MVRVRDRGMVRVRGGEISGDRDRGAAPVDDLVGHLGG